MLEEAIASAQHHNQDTLLSLIEKFKPLLKKYAYKLHYEDAFYDLQLDFIQIILAIDLQAQTKKSEGALVNYIRNSVQHAYCKRLKGILTQSVSTIELDALSSSQNSNLLTVPSWQDSSDLLQDISDILTVKERQVIMLIHKYQFSSAEVARKLNTTRQSVNQCKKRAEQKLRNYYNG